MQHPLPLLPIGVASRFWRGDNVDCHLSYAYRVCFYYEMVEKIYLLFGGIGRNPGPSVTSQPAPNQTKMTSSAESSSRETSDVTAEMESMNRRLLQFTSDAKFGATYISGRKAVHGPLFALLAVVFADCQSA